jgi:hypothetical protein
MTERKAKAIIERLHSEGFYLTVTNGRLSILAEREIPTTLREKVGEYLPVIIALLSKEPPEAKAAIWPPKAEYRNKRFL